MQLTDFTDARVLVLGDLMLDRYWHGGTSRISPEAPVPVVHVNQTEERAGGAGNVALNIAALRASVDVIGFCGQDEAGDRLLQILDNAGVSCLLDRQNGCPTITKLRVMSRHQQLIRLDFEESFENRPVDGLKQRLEQALPDASVLVLSDYGKGTLTRVSELIDIARGSGTPVLIDPKGTDFLRYRGATLITPNLAEFEAVVGRCHSDEELILKGQNLLQELSLEALLVTRGELGMVLLQNDGQVLTLPASAREVFDVTGAGDTVISTLAVALAAGRSLADATRIANAAAGVVVGKLGTATLTPEELEAALNIQTVVEKGVLDEEHLLAAIRKTQQSGEKVVATNGCFDILHCGHLRYLQQARELGDRLVVLVNSDDSVRKLKGPERPLNSLSERMEMLAGLSCVDWVIPFSEETPRELLCRLLPDILVKGGDYPSIESIAGHDCVLANGGEVRLLDFSDGHSTTGLIERIRKP